MVRVLFPFPEPSSPPQVFYSIYEGKYGIYQSLSISAGRVLSRIGFLNFLCLRSFQSGIWRHRSSRIGFRMLLTMWLYRFFWGLMGGMVEITSFSWGRVGWSFGLLWRSFLILISLRQSFSCYSTSTINFISPTTSLCFPFSFDQMLISSSDSYSQSTSYFSPYKSYTVFPI